MQQKAKSAEAVPAELKAISERIGRLQDRLRQGDSDFEPDELRAAIAVAEQRKLLGHFDLRPGPNESLWADYEICPAGPPSCIRFKRDLPNLREVCRLSGLPKIIVILHG